MALSRKTFHRLTVVALFGAAFLVMASVFSPSGTKAGDLPQPSNDRAGVAGSRATSLYGESTNPHEGLRSLGSLESAGFIVNMYSTADGPRYTIYERASRREVGTLMTLDKVQQFFPELQLKGLDFSASENAPGAASDGSAGPLMLVGPDDFGMTP